MELDKYLHQYNSIVLSKIRAIVFFSKQYENNCLDALIQLSMFIQQLQQIFCDDLKTITMTCDRNGSKMQKKKKEKNIYYS